MIRREILFPKEERRLKPLKSSPGSFNDLASSLPAKQGMQSPAHLVSARSLSYGQLPSFSGRPPPEAFPHNSKAYELISECGQGATAKVNIPTCNFHCSCSNAFTCHAASCHAFNSPLLAT